MTYSWDNSVSIVAFKAGGICMLDSRRLTWLAVGVGLLSGATLAFVQPLADSVQIPEWTVASFLAVALLATVVILDQRVHKIEQLQTHLQEAQEVLDALPQAMVTVGANGTIVNATSLVTRMFGYGGPELVGQTIDRLLPEPFRKEFLEGDGTELPRAEGDFVAKHKKGNDIPVHVQRSARRAADLVTTLFLCDQTKAKQTQDELRQREAFLQLISAQMPAILWTTDSALKITSSMGAGLSALNLRLEQILSPNTTEKPGGKDTGKDSELTPVVAQQRAVRGESVNFEMQWKDRALQVCIEPLRQADRSIAGTIGIILDVTERKQAISALKDRVRQQIAVNQLSQRALEGLDFDHVKNDAVRSIAETLRIDFCFLFDVIAESSDLRRVAHFAAGTVTQPLEDAIPCLADYALQLNQGIVINDMGADKGFAGASVLRQHGVVGGICTLIPGAKGPRGVLVACTAKPRPFNSDDAHFLQVIANLLATTVQRKEAEEARHRLVAILEATPDFVAIAGVDRQVLYLNRAARDKVGVEKTSQAGAITELFAESARKAFLQEQIPTAIMRGVCQGESLLRHRDGTEIPVSQLVLAHKSQAGAVEFFSIIGRDLRERRRLEEQLRQVQKMEAIGRLAGGVAHDFNNLLCVVNGYSELLVQKIPAEHEHHNLVKEIKKAGDRAALLTRQLLTFSRKQVVVPTVLNLNTLVSNLDRMLRRLIGEDTELKTNLAADLHTVKADAGQLEQILLNLAVNARDAMPHGGTFSISTSNVQLSQSFCQSRAEVKAGEFVLLTVNDTGIGMDDEVRTHLFEPFFTTKGMGKGTGLGLATVYGVVKQAGGVIDVDTQPGHGTSFKIYWPRCKEPVSVSDAKPAQAGAAGKEIILLVEDEDGVRHLARHILEQAGYIVLEAQDGEHACTICTEHKGPIHLLVSDVVMPKMSGGKLYKHLSTLYPGLKVLFVSGYSDSGLTRHGVVSNEVDCLMKPFTPEALTASVRAVLDRKPTASAPGRERRINRRRRLRSSVKIECRVHPLSPNIAIAPIDLSEKGVAVNVSAPLQKGQEVEVWLATQASYKPIKRMGEVAWVRPLPGHYQVGLRFTQRLDYADFAAFSAAETAKARLALNPA
jgi:two-component system cell cycle sensor histidine kinase/response regulator CckA